MVMLQEFTNFYAADNLMWVVFAALAGAAAIGHLLDKVLTDMAFGMVGNTFLVLMSMVVAVSIGRNQVTLISGDESVRIAMLACSMVVGLMLGLGALKAYLLRCRI